MAKAVSSYSIWEMTSCGSVAAILLASGYSKRFGGRNKLLIPFGGKPLARHTLELAASIGFVGGIFLITASDEVAALASGLCAVEVIRNRAPEKDLRESVRLGVLAGAAAEYWLFFHCDQPFLDAGTVSRILACREPGRIVEPRFSGQCRSSASGRPGNPCLFSAAFRGELLSLGERETPRLIKARHPELVRAVEVPNPLILEDIDDEETFARLAARLPGENLTEQKSGISIN